MSRRPRRDPSPRRASHHTNGTQSNADTKVDTSGLAETLQGHVDDIRGLLQCGVCIRPLYEPYTLACGHTFCYSCLTSWFSGGRSNKTCPDCRAAVKSQPAPAYLVRTLVQLFTSRAELLDKDETTTDHANHQREEAEKLDADRNNPNPGQAGLFRGSFNRQRTPARPIVDLEDNVVRCPHCSWELEEGTDCTQCGYRQDADSLSDSTGYMDDSEDISGDDMTDDFDTGSIPDEFAEMDEFDWDEFAGAFPGVDMGRFLMPAMSNLGRTGGHFSGHPQLPFHDHYGDWASEGRLSQGMDSTDYSDDTEMDSFIDDGPVEDDFSGSDRSTVVGAHDYGPRHGRDGGTPDSLLSGPLPYDEPEDSRHLSLPNFHELECSTVSETNDDEEESSEDDEEETDSDEDSDEESDEEDEPVRSTRDASRRRQQPSHEVTLSNTVRESTTTRPSNSSRSNSNLASRREDRVSRPSHTSRSQSGSTRHRDRDRRDRDRRERTRGQEDQSRGTSVSTAINLDDDSDEAPVGPVRRIRDRASYRQRAY